MDNCNGYVLSVTRFVRSASGSTTDPSKRKDVQDVMVGCDGYVLSVTGFSRVFCNLPQPGTWLWLKLCHSH